MRGILISQSFYVGGGIGYFEVRKVGMAKRQKIVLIILIAMLVINISSRIYMRARIYEYSRMKVAYIKLALAYNNGGMGGLKKEFSEMQQHAKFKIVREFLDKAKDKVETEKHPKEYLRSLIVEKENKINHLRQILLTLNIIVLSLIILRIIMNITAVVKKKEGK